MAVRESDRNRIIQQSEAWLDSQFGGIDLSSYPTLNPLPLEDKHDDRFAPAYESPSAALHRFIRNPDNEALERAGREIGNEELIEEVRDRQAGAIAREFKLQTPDYEPSDYNYEKIVAVLAFNLLERDGLDAKDAVAELIDRGQWTVRNLQSAWRSLKQKGVAELAPGTARNLTAQERLHVIRIAQQGNVGGAISQFLQYALDNDVLSNDLIYDPAYRKICDRATLFCFEASQLDYTPTPEHREFFRRYCADRPLTVALLQQAWTACQRNESLHERDELLGINQRQEAEAPSQPDFDALDDESLDQLYHQSVRQYQKTSKRGGGVLA